MFSCDGAHFISFSVTYTLQNTAYIASDSVTFITKSKPLIARISSNGKRDTEVPVSIGEDVMLRSHGKDQDDSEDRSYYLWTVEVS